MVISYSSPRKPIRCISAIGQVPQEIDSKTEICRWVLLEILVRLREKWDWAEVKVGMWCSCNRDLRLSRSPETGMALRSYLKLSPRSQALVPLHQLVIGYEQPHRRRSNLGQLSSEKSNVWGNLVCEPSATTISSIWGNEKLGPEIGNWGHISLH